MGSRVQKIAFLIFALMFVAIMAVLNTSILTLGTSANNQLNTTISSTDVSLQIYDDTIVSGANVRDAAKNPDGVCSTNLHIFVATSASQSQASPVVSLAAGTSVYGTEYYNDGTTDHSYNPATGTVTGSVVSGSASEQYTYINPTATFASKLLYNSNNVVVGIQFTQK